MNFLGRVVHPPNAEGFTSREVHPKEKYIAVDDSGFLQQSPETSGWDVAEGVFKVASYVWDTDTLQWVRATQAAPSGGSVTSIKKQLFDQPSPSLIYIGEADVGSLTSAPAWRIKRISFNASGFPLSKDYAALGAATQIWDNRGALSYS